MLDNAFVGGLGTLAKLRFNTSSSTASLQPDSCLPPYFQILNKNTGGTFAFREKEETKPC